MKILEKINKQLNENKAFEKASDLVAKAAMEISKLPLDRKKKVEISEMLRKVQDILRWYEE